jgi:hypothetical protein
MIDGRRGNILLRSMIQLLVGDPEIGKLHLLGVSHSVYPGGTLELPVGMDAGI